jgi:hypothetical protein
MSQMLLLMRLQDALIESTRPSRESTEAGGFVVMLTPTDPMVWLNYAVPVADTSLEGIDEMIAVFRNAGRVPRLEFFADLWPEVSTRLAEKGFYCEKRMPIMVLERANWKGLDHDHDVRPVDFATFTEMNRVLSDAFGGEPPEESDPYDDPMFQRILWSAADWVSALPTCAKSPESEPWRCTGKRESHPPSSPIFSIVSSAKRAKSHGSPRATKGRNQSMPG